MLWYFTLNKYTDNWVIQDNNSWGVILVSFLFFLLFRPPMSQSLLIMGWCSSIPEHRLRLHLDSGPISFSLSALRGK